MPKMKTHKSGRKRYKLTGAGKLMRNRAGRSHLNQKKSSQRKRRLDNEAVVAAGDVAKIRLELPYMEYARR